MEAPQLEEERRLFYVGMTRAERKLYLSSCRFRRYFGNADQQISEPSRFLNEVPADLVEDAVDKRRKQGVKYDGKSFDTVDAVMKVLGGGPSRAPTIPRGPASPSPRPPAGKKGAGAWSLGTRVKHPKYVDFRDMRRPAHQRCRAMTFKLTVSFSSYGLKKLVAKYAELEIA